MSQFEFVLVIIAIVLAFAVSDILSSWGEQIRLRRSVVHYPLHTAWTFLLLFIMIQVWWSLWPYSDQLSWSFPGYLALVLPFLTLALMAYLLTPKLEDPGGDVRQHYWENSSWIFSLGAAYLAGWALFSHVVVGNPLNEPGSVPRIVGIALMVLLALSRNERVHYVAVALAYIVMGVWLVRTGL